MGVASLLSGSSLNVSAILLFSSLNSQKVRLTPKIWVRLRVRVRVRVGVGIKS